MALVEIRQYMHTHERGAFSFFGRWLGSAVLSLVAEIKSRWGSSYEGLPLNAVYHVFLSDQPGSYRGGGGREATQDMVCFAAKAGVDSGLLEQN